MTNKIILTKKVIFEKMVLNQECQYQQTQITRVI